MTPEESAGGAGTGPTGLVFDIKRFAIHDGPGIRTTVFLKGCPLACRWCHNPESIRAGREHSWRGSRCTACGACAKACPRGAIEMRDGRPVTDAGRCAFCGRCVAACLPGAREIVGREMTVADVLAEVARDVVFYEESGGGVTFSGGEPLAQPQFLGACLAACRQRGLATAVDTTCHAPWEVLEAIRADTDLFLCDIKHVDSETHRRWTGVGNERILANLRRLAAAGERIRIRVPLIPGVNDGRGAIMAIGQFVSSLNGVTGVDVLPYNEAGRGKLDRLDGEGLPWSEAAPPWKAPPPEKTAEVVSVLSEMGLSVRTGG